MTFVLLLRGINVGTSVKISMKDLVSWLQEMGLERVSTYLNSGNALFDSELAAAFLERQIAEVVERKCGQSVPVLVKSADDMIQIAASIPPEWQNDQSQQTYVAYLFEEFAYEGLISELPVKKEFLQMHYCNQALVWNIKRENYNKSQITKIASHPAYGFMTTRNSNTARKLAELCRLRLSV